MSRKLKETRGYNSNVSIRRRGGPCQPRDYPIPSSKFDQIGVIVVAHLEAIA